MEDDQSSTSVSPLALGGALTGILVLIISIIYLFFRSPSSSSSSKTETDEIKSENDVKKQPTKSTTSKPIKQDPKTAAKFVHPWLCASLRAHSSSINGLDFSHNDKYLASAAEGYYIISSFLFILFFYLFR